jgi:N-acetylmuramoyl-L-alanine amidase
VRARRPAAPTGARHVGIQAGHWKTDDVPEELANLRILGGAVWGNVTEQQYVLGIAQKVALKLQEKGYVVDLLPTALPAGYVADAFVAIHADGDETATARGFKIAHGDRRTPYDEALQEVLAEEYWKSTDLPVDVNVTPAMLEYYAWRWEKYKSALSPFTPAVVIETGFITSAADRAVLLLKPDKVVDGIVNGVERFLNEVPRDAVFRDDLVFPRATPAPPSP